MGTILKRSTGTNINLTKGMVGELNELEAMRLAMTNEIMRAHKATAVFRMAFLIAACLALVFGLTSWYMATLGVQHHYAVVYVDQFAEEHFLPTAPTKPMDPGKVAIYGVIQRWVQTIRQITNDPVRFTQDWDDIEAFTTQVGLRSLANYRIEQEERQRGGRRVQVHVGRIWQKETKSRTYFINWDEDAVDVYGNPIGEETARWEGSVVVADFQSQVAQNELDLRRRKKNFRNLYGVFIDEIKWGIPKEEAKR